MITKEKLFEMADSHQKIADRAYRDYQETGMTRYDSKRRREEELSDALLMAANAAEDHNALVFLRGELARAVNTANQIKNHLVPPDKRDAVVKALCEDLSALGKIMWRQ